MFVTINGAQGEGGGQVLRTSLSLSMVTGQPFQIENIRAGRARPGLLRQHLTAVNAAAEVCAATVDGASLGSTRLTFTPGPVRPGEYRFAVGTAGSATLVFQTVLPALMLAGAPSSLTLEGGTHNPAAPPFDFLARAFLPLLNRMGPTVTVNLERYGFYPAGGGRFTASIQPVAKLSPLALGERAEVRGRRAIGLVANLPARIAEREIATAIELLAWPPETRAIMGTRESNGPGNAFMLELESPELTEIFTAFGEVGVSAESVAKRAAHEAKEYLASTAAAGEHLTDQLLLPLALAGRGAFTAVKLNGHAETNMDVIRRFIDAPFQVEPLPGHIRVSL
ncbi:MAG: RNA 3'-terminal phosphate cyclase [Bryobacterales bacterium]|nr:RNA 3'-terminal phosphate cyclase [Bryobacterales bacterium]